MCEPCYCTKHADFARFLLAKLHLESLEGKTSPKSIRATLKALPTGSDAYDRAYKKVIERIEGQHQEQKELAKKVLAWITCAKRPLTTVELQHALAVELGTSEIDKDNFSPIELMVSVCAGLVTIEEANSVIRLVHHTAQEYFKRTREHWFPDADTDITRVCITYLTFSVFDSGFCKTLDEFCGRLESNRLFDYAAQNWGHHARTLSIEEDKFILDFLQNEAKISACTQAMLVSKMDYWAGNETQMTGLHITAYFGLEHSTEALLNESHNPNHKDFNDRMPLHYAAENGHQEVVKLLLDKGANSNIQDNYRSLTPLHYAVEKGHRELVKLLLQNGADPNIEGNGYYNQTPLYDAVENGHREVVKLLLDMGANPNVKSKGFFSRTPLHYAVENNYVESVELLLEKGADPNNHDSYRFLAPLHCVAQKGYQELAKLLLKNGADPNIKRSGCHNQRPLHYAVENGHQELVKILLQKGADPNVWDTDRSLTPLECAVVNGFQEMVKLLLEKGADPNVGDRDRNLTPLHVAMEKGDHGMVKVLLNGGANPNNVSDSICGDSQTPLYYAARNGYREMVKLLLDSGADPNIKSSFYKQTPLHYLVLTGHQEMVKLLLDSGADPQQ